MTTASADAILVMPLAIGGDGLRVAVKDTIDIAGLPTRAGTAALADAPPAAANADVIDAVLAAGCRIIGKANLHELAFGVTGVNPVTGTPLNPRFPDRVPGGSSSGSAASVAAGMADFALGTDTGGSIRTPACCCGIYGLKPTWGRISRKGVMPPVSSLDCVGPFAATPGMLATAMAILDPTFKAETLDHTPRLGRLTVDGVAPAVSDAIDRALAAARPDVQAASVAGLDDAYEAGLVIINSENSAAIGPLTENPGMGADIRARLLAGSKTATPEAVAAAEAVRARVTADVDAALDGLDALVLPTMPDVPPKLSEAGEARAAVGITRTVRAFNLTGHPALTLPLLTADGLPAGLQIVGRKGDEARLIAVAAWLAAALPAGLQP